jgi:glycerol uptake facilitator-like aquaporin
MTASLAHRAAAEALGTMLLLATVVGSGIMGDKLDGGIEGVLLAHLMFALPVLQLSVHVRTGAGQWLAEALATFGLIVVILGSSARSPERTPVLVGLYIVAAYWFTASTSFANPAVTLARALTDTFAGIRPLDVPGFALAQIAGALLGLVVGQRLFAQETP